MKIERVAFEEIPNEIQEQVKKKFRDRTDRTEILEVMVYDYLNGNKEYIVKAINDLCLIEISIHNKLGITSYNSISLPTVLLAMEKVQHKFSYMKGK